MTDAKFFATLLNDSADDHAARWPYAEWLAERGHSDAGHYRWLAIRARRIWAGLAKIRLA